MNLPQAHGIKQIHSLFFPAPLKGWWGVVVLRVGAQGKARLQLYFKVAVVLAI